jgi:hypothetical protein
VRPMIAHVPYVRTGVMLWEYFVQDRGCFYNSQGADGIASSIRKRERAR